ncbi:MAG: bifunctional DNA-formamidopyrimidine glycosylase/DNA-(apurinic or apyrimidinic site) lyase [Planctomycetota bacterium]|nr:bifunctional DNA-formamidopyrimidine glycosylase/DNA-(apurinic or apyrimidinic site) lyase [Planctomycetota bacterium]
MPELPEVETTARLIRPDLVGRVVTGFEVEWERTLGGVTRRTLARLLRGRVCTAVERRAKYVLIAFAEPEEPEEVRAWLVVHLRMTGRLVHSAPGEAPASHRRFGLCLGEGRGEGLRDAGRIDFLDPRKFGRCVATTDPYDVLPELGPEPLGEGFTTDSLRAGLASRRRQLKPLLLDQSFLAGLGNIYVDEALFLARLHPLTSSDRVSRPKAEALFAAIRAVLTEAIEREGSSFDGFYRTPTGQPGSYQHQFQVYGRHGKPCRVCAAEIRRIVVGQRGTHFCPRCQRRAR